MEQRGRAHSFSRVSSSSLTEVCQSFTTTSSRVQQQLRASSRLGFDPIAHRAASIRSQGNHFVALTALLRNRLPHLSDGNTAPKAEVPPARSLHHSSTLCSKCGRCVLRKGAQWADADVKEASRITERLWRLVRAGRTADARKMCRSVGQPWRAASLGGAVGPGPIPVGSAALEVSNWQRLTQQTGWLYPS